MLAAQGERDEGGARLDDLEAELPRQFIGEASGAHFGDRRPAGGYNQRLGRERTGSRCDGEAVARIGDIGDFLFALDLDSALFAFCQQHIDDLLGRSVAEQLAQRFFMMRNAVAINKLYEIARRVSGERALGEMHIGRKVVCRTRIHIGEVATTAAGDQDLLANLVRAFEHHHAFAALPEGTVDTLLKPENKGQLTDVLLYHVDDRNLTAADIPAGKNYFKPVLASERLCIAKDSNGVMISDGTGEMANVIIADIQASNGVIHVIDKVLLPGERPAC